MSLIDKIYLEETWNEFLEYKINSNQLNKKELAELKSFIAKKKYLDIHSFSIPKKKLISKIGASKKRVVYTFNDDEMWFLKCLTYLLYKYDNVLSNNCYSFRKSIGVKSAFATLLSIKNLDEKYTLKLDIHDYFNSIPVDKLLSVLSDIITDDPSLLEFLSNILLDSRVEYNGEILEEQKGAMAGVPLASFFANIYLLSLDRYFEDRNIPYFRYSDDILVLADTKEELDFYYNIIQNQILEKGLTFNPKKMVITNPNDPFTFLGLKYENGKVGLADISIEKMKGKIKRKAHNLYRKKKRNKLTYEQVAKSFIRSFDAKFYDLTGDNRFTWTRWYFPILNDPSGLKEIDEYMVKYLRFLATGRHNKGNYKIEYEYLKSLGYTSLVNEFYTWKKDNIRLQK